MQQKRYHLIIDVSHVTGERLVNEDGLKKLLISLPPVIGMHVLAGPLIATGIPKNPGISGLVIIDFSHISIHTFSAHNEALVDIFSCKPFKQEAAIDAVLTYFNVKKKDARIKEVFWG